MRPDWGSVLGVAYVIGGILTLWFQIVMSPNATPGLMALRILVWPVYWITGWPSGVPMQMD